jgi:hypothetical protein
MFKVLLAALAAVVWSGFWSGAVAASCVPPPGFVDTAPPEIGLPKTLVAHIEEVTINRSLDVVLAVEAGRSLEQTIDRHTSLPGVSGTYVLTERKWGEPGGRRLTCLTDGSTLEEQVLAHAQEGKTYHFRYVVWNYTTEKARPIVYGVGDFLSTDLGDGRTHVRWTYAFELNRGRFPGYLGALGRFLFRVGFLDREYADMMRNSLAATKAGAERTPLADQK